MARLVHRSVFLSSSDFVLVATRRSRLSWPTLSLLRRPRSNAGNVQPYPVHARLCGQIQSSAVIITPRQIVGMLRACERAQMFAVWRNDPQPARTRDVEVPLPIDFDPVDRIFPRCPGHIEEGLAVRQG